LLGRDLTFLAVVGLAEAGVPPEEQGIKSASVVKRYGLRLLPEWHEHLNPMPFEVAAPMEVDLAEDLRLAGYMVTGGH
jgi:hypothetical protein